MTKCSTAIEMVQKYNLYCIFVLACNVVFKYQNCKCFAQTYCTTLEVYKTFVHINLKVAQTRQNKHLWCLQKSSQFKWHRTNYSIAKSVARLVRYYAYIHTTLWLLWNCWYLFKINCTVFSLFCFYSFLVLHVGFIFRNCLHCNSSA